MMTSMLRFGRPAVIGGLVLFMGSAAGAQEKTPFPALTDQRVYVAGVPDRYNGLADQIKRLERSSPQTYYVVVVKSTGSGDSATRVYTDDLIERWRSQASRRGLSIDPERSVITVVALEQKRVVVRAGETLRNRFGLDVATVERELIDRVFIPLAKQDRYPEAISALLDSTNNWIAARDSKTAAVPVAGAAAKDSSGSRPATTEVPNSSTTSLGVSTPSRQATSGWFPAIVLGVLVLAVGLVGVGWAWMVHRRTRNRVAGRIKEIKSKAVDVMDRLDGLKERLKLLPTSTDFKQPMTGETQALYNDRQRQSWASSGTAGSRSWRCSTRHRSWRLDRARRCRRRPWRMPRS